MKAKMQRSAELRPDGGPAFPVVALDGMGHVSDGMSLRAWLAGQALTGCIVGRASVNIGWPPDDIAGEALGIADALVRALQAPPS